MTSILSRFSSMSLRAMAYCSSMMRRTSASTSCIVFSEMLVVFVTERPRNTSPSFSRVDHGPEPVAHAVAHHHVAGHLRGALEVVRSAGRHLVHEDLLGDAAAEENRDARDQIVERHHGYISVESELGKGTTFTIHLPPRAHGGRGIYYNGALAFAIREGGAASLPLRVCENMREEPAFCRI